MYDHREQTHSKVPPPRCAGFRNIVAMETLVVYQAPSFQVWLGEKWFYCMFRDIMIEMVIAGNGIQNEHWLFRVGIKYVMMRNHLSSFM